jgi:hypothetical protein
MREKKCIHLNSERSNMSTVSPLQETLLTKIPSLVHTCVLPTAMSGFAVCDVTLSATVSWTMICCLRCDYQCHGLVDYDLLFAMWLSATVSWTMICCLRCDSQCHGLVDCDLLFAMWLSVPRSRGLWFAVCDVTLSATFSWTMICCLRCDSQCHGLVDCDSVQTGGWVTTFRKKQLPVSSGYSSKCQVRITLLPSRVEPLVGPRTNYLWQFGGGDFYRRWTGGVGCERADRTLLGRGKDGVVL